MNGRYLQDMTVNFSARLDRQMHSVQHSPAALTATNMVYT